ncbi:MAG: ATP synthase F1 subunit delta [Thermodesulfobacteriota bacterium]|nr:ATP synthase F1 subunit delta [Thermodesulfobacteriota bacterium]
MKNYVIQRRYAKALMLIGKEDNNAEQYKEELNGFVSVLDMEKAFEGAITNPLYPVEARRKVLDMVIEKLGVSVMMRSFLTLLFEKRRIQHVRGINEVYQNLVDELKGIVRADVVSACELSDDVVEKIRASLSKMTGKQVVVDIAQDPTLIGGIVTKVGDMVLDGSIKTQLSNMKESLKKGERV